MTTQEESAADTAEPAHGADEVTAIEASSTAVAAEAKPGPITRTRLWVHGSKTRVVNTVERLERQRPGNRIIDAAFESVETDTQTGGDLLARAVAFRYFLLFVPFVFERSDALDNRQRLRRIEEREHCIAGCAGKPRWQNLGCVSHGRRCF